MALGPCDDACRAGWLWVPAGTATVLIETIGGGGVTLSDAAGQVVPAQPGGRPGLWRWSNLPPDAAIHCLITSDARGIAIDGIPGLMTATAAMAADLTGGTSTVAGRVVEGPIQARARAWMLHALAGGADAPQLAFPAALPAAVAQPQAVLQLYGVYAPLSGLASVLASQDLDPRSITFGTLPGPGDGTLHGPDFGDFDALGLASAIMADGELNPAAGNRALITRATLLAFYHLARLQGDDLIREGDIARDGYPMSHAFFIDLGAIAGPYALLRPVLDPDAARIWQDGVIAVADRLADYRGYQTNQFWHMALAHLDAYRSTGEQRFRHWFERDVRDLVGGVETGTSTFRQHPAGYFLEDGGPDGNYDAISATCLVEAWHAYLRLPDADPVVVELLHDAIGRNLIFNACHWLPQPDGTRVAPSAMCTRKPQSFLGAGWPGALLARDAFPLASARWLLTVPPAHGSGAARLFPYLATSDRWASAALAEEVPLGDHAFRDSSHGIPAAWTCEAIAAAKRPVSPAAVLPCQGPDGLWDLPGQLAWKRGALYGLVFWGVPGADPAGSCRMGGAPSAPSGAPARAPSCWRCITRASRVLAEIMASPVRMTSPTPACMAAWREPGGGADASGLG